MSTTISHYASALAIAAAISLAAAPVAAEAHDRHGGRHGHWGHRNDGVDAGDIMAGVLILGGIAAVASTAAKAKDRYEERDRYRNRDGWRYGERNERPAWADPSRLDDVVDTCVAEVDDSGGRVSTVDVVRRVSDGWRVEGRTDAGRDFACLVDANGRIRSVTVDGRAPWNGEGPRFVSEPVIQPVER